MGRSLRFNPSPKLALVSDLIVFMILSIIPVPVSKFGAHRNAFYLFAGAQIFDSSIFKTSAVIRADGPWNSVV